MGGMRSEAPRYQAKSPASFRTLRDGRPEQKPNIAIWGLDMLRGHGDQADFPEVSGLAPKDELSLIAIRDTKPFHFGSSVVGTVNKETGVYSPLDVDWSATGKPFDLEAIAATEEEGRYLAVEGSRFFGRRAKLWELKIDDEGARSVTSHALPKLPQEIEGLLVAKSGEGEEKLILAGRGDGEQSEVYWGTLTEEGLHFNEAGLEGMAIDAPYIADDQRGLTELQCDDKGQVWASATATVGGIGEYRSALYQLGQLDPQQEPPIKLEAGDSYFVDGPKVEAIASDGNTFFLGSDNETLKGRFDELHLA